MLKVALIQLLVSANKSNNILLACSKVKLAAERGAKLICLPECFNCPYGVKYFSEYSENIPVGKTLQSLSQVAKEHSIWLVGGSIPEMRDGKIYNTSCAFNPQGEMIGKYSKIHLFDIDVPGKITFKESEVLTAGNDLFSFDLPINKDTNVVVGIGICYDLRFPELAHIYTRQRKCNLLLYPGAFNMTTGPLFWELYGRCRAVDNQCYVGLCSVARDTNADYISYGHTLASNPWGEVISSLDEKEGILEFDVDINVINNARSMIPISKQRREDVYTIATENNVKVQ